MKKHTAVIRYQKFLKYQKVMDKIVKSKIPIEKKLKKMLEYDQKVITHYEPKD